MRRTAFANLADAIAKAVSKSHANGPTKGDRIHESGAAAEKDRASKKVPSSNDNHKYAAFKGTVLAQYGSAASCFAKFSGKDGMMSRKDFKVPSCDSFSLFVNHFIIRRNSSASSRTSKSTMPSGSLFGSKSVTPARRLSPSNASHDSSQQVQV